MTEFLVVLGCNLHMISSVLYSQMGPYMVENGWIDMTVAGVVFNSWCRDEQTCPNCETTQNAVHRGRMGMVGTALAVVNLVLLMLYAPERRLHILFWGVAGVYSVYLMVWGEPVAVCEKCEHKFRVK